MARSHTETKEVRENDNLCLLHGRRSVRNLHCPIFKTYSIVDVDSRSVIVYSRGAKSRKRVRLSLPKVKFGMSLTGRYRIHRIGQDSARQDGTGQDDTGQDSHTL